MLEQLIQLTQYLQQANSTGVADGDTPIRFWDFNNGITIFEATSCGLDNLAWGAEECIACPSGDCEYCTTKDEYVDRVTGVPHSIGPGVVVGDLVTKWKLQYR